MRSTKSLILLVVALGCGLIAAIGFGQVLKNTDGSAQGQKMETIFVAAGDIPSQAKLDSTNVRSEEWPVDKIPANAARALEDFEGMKPIYPLYPGEPIVSSKLDDGSKAGPSGRIPEGHHVMTVNVDRESAIAGLVNPGDKVDVLVFIRGRSNDQINTGTRTIMRNVTVFAVNDQIARSSDEDSRIDAKTVSLLVLPEQSEKLLLAKELGTIHLALRKPGDESEIDTTGALPGDLNGNGADTGSDGQIPQSSEEKPTDGIFGILQNVTKEDSKAVDSSSAPGPSQPEKTMVIMSPDGVIAAYTFDRNAKSGGLPGLPQELLDTVRTIGDGIGSDTLPETDDFDSDASSDPTDDDGVTDDGGDVLDPSVLGF